jgi:hypothetical protein
MFQHLANRPHYQARRTFVFISTVCTMILYSQHSTWGFFPWLFNGTFPASGLWCFLSNRNQLKPWFVYTVGSDYWLTSKKLDFLSKLLLQKICRYVLYINNDQNPRMFDCTPGSEQAVTGSHLSAPREADPLTLDIILHKNSFLLQESKIIRLKL